MRGNRHYVHLAIMTALSFISMYILMYAMVNRFANVYSNLNQFYMAGLMTAPVVVIELALMGSRYKHKNGNIIIVAISVVVLGAFLLGIRQQAAIGDKNLLRSMIPHHAGAILMCERAPIQDAEIKKLCKEPSDGFFIPERVQDHQYRLTFSRHSLTSHLQVAVHDVMASVNKIIEMPRAQI